MFRFEQSVRRQADMLGEMPLQRIKHVVSAVWVVAVIVVAIAVDLSWTGGVVLAAVGALPPLALLLLWNEPAPSMSETISRARR
jgi:hypothetical protein